MLPRLDGIEVFRRIRALDPSSAVIMLTARGQQTERIAGLESGADDYVAKPFSPREVVARVKTILRRARQARSRGRAGAAGRRSIYGELEIDAGGARGPARRRAVVVADPEGVRAARVPRRPPAASPSAAVELLDELWDVAYDGDPSTVTVHVRRLREKIERDPGSPAPPGHRLGRRLPVRAMSRRARLSASPRPGRSAAALLAIAVGGARARSRRRTRSWSAPIGVAAAITVAADRRLPRGCSAAPRCARASSRSRCSRS